MPQAHNPERVFFCWFMSNAVNFKGTVQACNTTSYCVRIQPNEYCLQFDKSLVHKLPQSSWVALKNPGLLFTNKGSYVAAYIFEN